MSFEFDFFEEHNPSEDNNLVQVMERLEDRSFDFDNFDDYKPP